MSDVEREALAEVERLIHDYAVIRGDLVEQYARDQLRDKLGALLAQVKATAGERGYIKGYEDGLLAPQSEWMRARDEELATARAEALEELPVSLVEYVRASGYAGVVIASRAGITPKHLSQMLHHKGGSIDAWVRVVHAVRALGGAW